MDIKCGNSLFGDFTVILGFDDDPEVANADKWLSTVAWVCKHCGNGGYGHDEMVGHARTHFPVEVASRAGE